jgi:phage shock protein C
VDQTPPRPDERRLTRSRTNRILGGVASGLGRYLGVDVLWIRIAFAVLALAWGGGVILYAIAWILIPEEDPDAPPPSSPLPIAPDESARLIVGVLLISLGAILLVNFLAPGVSRYFWPLALIAVGIAIIVQSSGWRR